MRRAVEGFKGLEHALEPVAEIDGVSFVNDSKATNIEAALRAIQSFDAGVVVDPGRTIQGRRLRGPAGGARESSRPRSWRSARRAPLIHAALDGARARARCGRHGRGGARPRSRSRRPGRRWCSRRPARASTCSATTRSAAACSNRRWRDSRSEWKCDTRALSSHQPGCGGEELAAGNAGCPGLRGWCLPPRPADDC